MLPVRRADDGLRALAWPRSLIAIVMPRSLNDPVGLRPSNLSQHLGADALRQLLGMDERCAALVQGDHGRALEHRQPVAVLADHAPPLVGHQEPSTRMTELTPRTTSSPRRRSTVADSAASRRGVRDDDEVGAGAPRRRRRATTSWRTVSIDTSWSAKAAATGRAHRTVLDVEADVVPRERVAHGEDAQVGVGRLPGPRPPPTRWRATATRSPSTARGGGIAAGALTVEHQLAGGVGLDEDGVVRLAHAGERVRARDHRRVHADADARRRLRSQIASSLTTESISRAAATSAAVTSVMPSR